MKRRSLTLVLCLLATLSLVSVGFASWVISAGDVESATGQFVVETVEDKRVKIVDLKFDTVTYIDSNGAIVDTDAEAEGIQKPELPKFVFGKDDSEITYDWLQQDTSDKLSIEVTFKVKKVEGGAEITDTTKVSVAFAASDGAFAVGDGKVYAAIKDAEPDVTYENGSFKCTLELTWGDVFGAMGTNPYAHYNNLEITDELAEEAKAALEAMYAKLNAASYTVTISAEAAE